MTSRPVSSISSLEPEAQLTSIVHAGVHLGGEIVDASAVAVDGSGATYYVGVHVYSEIRTGFSPGRIETIKLPEPTSETSAFFIIYQP